MNIELEEDKLAVEYATEHGCTVAAARLALGQKPGQPPVVEYPKPRVLAKSEPVVAVTPPAVVVEEPEAE
jgi:hypothetical protein